MPDDDSFHSLFEFLPIGAYRTALDGRQLRANPALIRLNGFTTEAQQLAAAADGKRWYVQPGRRDEFLEILHRDGRVVGFESEVQRESDGQRLWVRENAHIVRDAAGTPLYYEGTIEDVTALVDARDALRRSQGELQQIIELVPGVVYRVAITPEGGRRYTFVSAGVRALYGIEPDEPLREGDALTRRRHPDDAARVRAASDAAIAANRVLLVDTRVLLDDGTEKWVQVLSGPAPDDHGERIRVGLLFDITDRKRAEFALQENSELWKRALESSGDGVWDWHVQDGVEVLSPACKALYGFAPSELPDTPDALDARTHPDDVPAMRQAREEHFAGRTPAYVNEHRVMCKDGSWKRILSRGIVIARDAAGRPLRMIGTHTDVTAARQAEALRHERDLAAAARLAQAQFLSRVSHELRTPLNAVLGFAQLLEMAPGDGERQRTWISHVLASGRHLLALVNDVLDLSSAQTGQLPISVEVLPAAALLDEAQTLLAGAAQEARVALAFDAEGTAAGLQLRADRKRALQVLVNLVSNAIKYNHPGGLVRVSVSRGEGSPGEVAIAVADTGPGLTASQRARLFQPFERLGAQHGPVPGTGLGLALARQFAEAMQGSIEVQSEPGHGSVFTLRLPAA